MIYVLILCNFSQPVYVYLFCKRRAQQSPTGGWLRTYAHVQLLRGWSAHDAPWGIIPNSNEHHCPIFFMCWTILQKPCDFLCGIDADVCVSGIYNCFHYPIVLQGTLKSHRKTPVHACRDHGYSHNARMHECICMYIPYHLISYHITSSHIFRYVIYTVHTYHSLVLRVPCHPIQRPMAMIMIGTYTYTSSVAMFESVL